MWLLLNPFNKTLSQEVIIKSQSTLDSYQKDDQNQNTITDPIKRLVNLLNQSYFTNSPIGDVIADSTLEESYLIQENFVQTLTHHLGKPIGYKVGLTNAIAQERLQVNHPVKGILLEKMLLENGAIVNKGFAAIPRIEGDLIVRVGSDKINQAKTVEEVIKSLDAVIPFLELPDLMFEKDVKLSASKLVSVNVGAKLGVVGKPILLENKRQWQNQLSQIKVTIKDSTGRELGTGSSDSLLNDPLAVVLWLKNQLESQGKELKKGDLISLGSMTAFIKIPTGETVTATYQGLEKDQVTTVTITFTD